MLFCTYFSLQKLNRHLSFNGDYNKKNMIHASLVVGCWKPNQASEFNSRLTVCILTRAFTQIEKGWSKRVEWNSKRTVEVIFSCIRPPPPPLFFSLILLKLIISPVDWLYAYKPQTHIYRVLTITHLYPSSLLLHIHKYISSSTKLNIYP